MTGVLREAERRGAKIVTGIGMLVQKGALNFKLWTGIEPPVDVMYTALKNEWQPLMADTAIKSLRPYSTCPESFSI